MATPRLYVAGTVTPVAPVAALPTTAAHFALWNGEPLGGKTYTITALSFTGIASAAAALVSQLLVNVSGASRPIISGTAATGPRATDGLTSTSNAVVASAVTIGATWGIWHPVGMSVNGGAATATISMGAWQNVRGLYYLPPGGVISLAVLCSAAGGSTCDIFVNWEEAQLV